MARFSVEQVWMNKRENAHRCGAELSSLEGHLKTVFITSTDDLSVTVRSRFVGGADMIRDVATIIESHPDEDTPLFDEQIQQAADNEPDEDLMRRARFLAQTEGRINHAMFERMLDITGGLAIRICKRLKEEGFTV